MTVSELLEHYKEHDWLDRELVFMLLRAFAVAPVGKRKTGGRPAALYSFSAVSRMIEIVSANRGVL
jgi:hypothetical protein